MTDGGKFRIRNEQMEQLAAKVRNHPASEFDGQDSPDEVIIQLLEERLSNLEEEAGEVAQEQARLKEQMGIGDGSTEEELGEGSDPNTAAERQQNRLRDKWF